MKIRGPFFCGKKRRTTEHGKTEWAPPTSLDEIPICFETSAVIRTECIRRSDCASQAHFSHARAIRFLSFFPRNMGTFCRRGSLFLYIRRKLRSRRARDGEMCAPANTRESFGLGGVILYLTGLEAINSRELCRSSAGYMTCFISATFELLRNLICEFSSVTFYHEFPSWEIDFEASVLRSCDTGTWFGKLEFGTLISRFFRFWFGFFKGNRYFLHEGIWTLVL